MRKITVDVETPRRQTMLFSATFADDVSDLATWITRRAVEVRVGMKDPLRANKDVPLGQDESVRFVSYRLIIIN